MRKHCFCFVLYLAIFPVELTVHRALETHQAEDCAQHSVPHHEVHHVITSTNWLNLKIDIQSNRTTNVFLFSVNKHLLVLALGCCVELRSTIYKLTFMNENPARL